MTKAKETAASRSELQKTMDAFSCLWKTEVDRFEEEVSRVATRGIEQVEEMTLQVHRLSVAQLDTAQDVGLLVSQLSRVISRDVWKIA